MGKKKSRTHLYDELVDLLIELALERENDSHMEKFLKKHLGRGGTPTPKRGEGKGPKNPTNVDQGGGKGKGNLRAMNEVKPDAGTPPLAQLALHNPHIWANSLKPVVVLLLRHLFFPPHLFG